MNTGYVHAGSPALRSGNEASAYEETDRSFLSRVPRLVTPRLAYGQFLVSPYTTYFAWNQAISREQASE